MKKRLLLLSIAAFIFTTVNAQLLLKFQFGVKGGIDLPDFSNFQNNNGKQIYNRAGYVGGFWARVGAAGVYFQPELYLTSKTVAYNNNSYLAYTLLTAGSGNGTYDKYANRTTMTSIDVPLLIGTKFGVLGTGIRLNTGLLISFAVNNKQTLLNGFQNAVAFRYKNQNYAWQFGAGLDVLRFSADVRYEAGLSEIQNDYGDTRHINLYNITIGYRLF